MAERACKLFAHQSAPPSLRRRFATTKEASFKRTATEKYVYVAILLPFFAHLFCPHTQEWYALCLGGQF